MAVGVLAIRIPDPIAVAIHKEVLGSTMHAPTPRPGATAGLFPGNHKLFVVVVNAALRVSTRGSATLYARRGLSVLTDIALSLHPNIVPEVAALAKMKARRIYT